MIIIIQYFFQLDNTYGASIKNKYIGKKKNIIDNREVLMREKIMKN